MNSSASSPKRVGKSSYEFKEVKPFDLFYQLTYMSAMASAGITRRKTFEIAALASSPVASYFKAINTLVDEMRYDYPEACRAVGEKTKSEDVRTLLLRLSDALRSGEPLAEFMAREAEVQGQNYKNLYERDLEALKNWTDAFSSIIVSVALIVIIQLVSAMIYSMDSTSMAVLGGVAVLMGFFGTWIISRSAPQEVVVVTGGGGSADQRRARKFASILIPAAGIAGLALAALKIDRGWTLIVVAMLLLPIGVVGLISDQQVTKKDTEFSTLLRSLGGMATSTGGTLKQALTKIDLTSFPTLQPDLSRLSKRLHARVDPDMCWETFGQETGSQLIHQSADVFYSAVKLGGHPERVGYLCSLFVATTSQLRAKRSIVAGTFSGLSVVMQVVIAGLMVFVLEIINNFMRMMQSILKPEDLSLANQNIALPMSSLTPQQIGFLTLLVVGMIVLMAGISTVAIAASDGGFKFKSAFYLAIQLFISGGVFLVVPPLVAGIVRSTQ